MLSICQWTGVRLRFVTKFVFKLGSCEARARHRVACEDRQSGAAEIRDS